MELSRHDGTTFIDCTNTVKEYTDGDDWRIKANSNTTYSNAGLVNNTAGKVIANYWLDHVYSPEEGKAHREGDYHIHDLDCLTPYCAGWNLRALLNEGFNGVRSRVNSRPPHHFREALGLMANFLGILQSEWAGAQAFSSFDTFLAPYVFKDKLSFKSVKKAIRGLVYNLNVPSRWGQCVNSSYKCLRGDGKWVSHNDLKVGDSIYVVDVKTGALKKDTVTHVNVFNAPETMHRYSNEQGFSFDVTPNHRVIYKTGSNPFAVKESSELISKKGPVYIPISSWNPQTPESFMGNEYDIDDELLEFITFIMCDGCIVSQEGKSTRIEFYKSPSRYGCDRFEELCSILNIDYSVSKDKSVKFEGSYCNKYRLKNSEVVSQVISMLDGDKHKCPKFMSFLSPRQAYIVLDTWVLLDGNFDGSHWKMQADTREIQEMLAFLTVLAGKAASLKERVIGDNKTATSYTNVYKRGCRTCTIKEVSPKESTVWCPTTNTGTFVCMTDDGYIFLTGNSPFTNVTIDWTVPDDLKDSEPLSGGFHLLEGINDQELLAKAVERGVECLEEMTYKHFQPEMNMIQKAYYEVMTEGDSTGQPFTFPIPTVNITEEFDWEGENVLTLFENTAKIGSSYFQNFVGSQYKIDENGNRVEDEEAYKPSLVRSMCPLDYNEKVIVRSRWDAMFAPIGEVYKRHCKGAKYECFYNGEWIPAKVVKVLPQKLYHITLANNSVYKMGDKHEQPILRDGQKLLVTAEDILPGDMIPFNTSTIDAKLINSSYELGYAVGAYLGDGSKDGNGINYSLDAASKDDITEKLLRNFWEGMGYRVSVTISNNCRSVRVGAGSYDVIKKYFSGDSAISKSIASNILSQSVEMRTGLIDGCIATDGDRTKSRIWTSSKVMVEDLIAVFNSIGIKAYCSFKDTRDGRLGTNACYAVSYIKDRENYRGKYMTVDGQLYWVVTNVEAKDNHKPLYCLATDSTHHLFTLKDGLVTHNCRLQLDLNELRKRGNGLFGSAESTGSIGVVTINLARLGYKFKGDKRGLYKELDRLMVMAKSTLEKKRTVVTDLFNRGLYPYTKRYLPGGYNNHFSTIGVNGGNEMIRNFTEDKYDITSKWGSKFAEDLLNYIRKRMKDFQNETGNLYNLEATPGEGTTYRFAREDLKRYPDIIQAGCKEKNQMYYTNSTQLPSWYTDDLFAALKLQDTLQTRYTGGCVEAGNYVITDRGRILIDELCNNKEKYEGIKVISYNLDTNKSEWDLVTDFHKIDVSDKDKIRIKGNASLDITTSDWHPFFVVTPEGQVEERRADELKPGDYLLQNSDSLFDTNTTNLTPELAYVLGFYIGDGSMSRVVDNRGGNNIEKSVVRFHHANKKRLERVAEILRKYELANITPRLCDKRSKNLMCLTTTAKAMTTFLHEYGFTEGKKTLSVCLSSKLKEELNEENAYALLSGLFDTDAYLDPKYDNIEYFTGSRALAEDILWMTNMLGIRCSLTIKHDPRYAHPHFKLHFPARQLYKIEERLMCTRRPAGTYKSIKERNITVKGLHNVVQVTEVSKVDVEDNMFYDLTTEKNHNYLCGKLCYTFIHNTVFHMYMSEMVSSPEACRDIVRKVLTNFKMPYITVTPLFSVCDKHGYLKGRHDYCPLCDEEIIQEERNK